MRRIVQLSVACLAAGAVAACSSRDAVTTTGVDASGGVRFINAVPDTGGSGGIDFRFVDLVENNAQYAVPYRNNISTSSGIAASTLIQYKNTLVGDARHFRIFLDDTLTAVAQQKLGCASGAATCVGDSTMKIEKLHNYTALLWGNSRTGSAPAMKLTIIDETTAGCADPGTQVGYRAINATNGGLDIRMWQNTAVATAVATTTKSKDSLTKPQPTTATVTTTVNTVTVPQPTTPTFTVAPMSISTCVNIAPTPYIVVNVGPTVTLSDTTTTVTTVTTTVTTRYNVQPQGGGTALFTDASALIGIPNGALANGCSVGVDCDATPGASAAGTVLTGIIFPRSVAGTKAPQSSAFAVPAISFMWDRRPTRLSGT